MGSRADGEGGDVPEEDGRLTPDEDRVARKSRANEHGLGDGIAKERTVVGLVWTDEAVRAAKEDRERRRRDGWRRVEGLRAGEFGTGLDSNKN
ncbi:hypothetical protein HDU96_010969 [Phlyctochytrium bullatum]|nr:hypothetical protein HDU96_010969 [Phlyctochytrium bullatum]